MTSHSCSLEKSILRVKSETNCLAQALIIAIAKITDDPNYMSYSNWWKLGPVVQLLLETTGIKLDRRGGIRDPNQFQEYFKECRIVVFSGFNGEGIMFDGQVHTEKRINLLYDEVARRYHEIVNITGAMVRTSVCKACYKVSPTEVTCKCEQACMYVCLPCASSDVRNPCESCNRNFRSRTWFDKQKKIKLRGKTVCEQKKNCVSCGSSLTNKKHVCFKLYCSNCKRNMVSHSARGRPWHWLWTGILTGFHPFLPSLHLSSGPLAYGVNSGSRRRGTSFALNDQFWLN